MNSILVAIPTYNCENSIAKTILSARLAGYKNIKIFDNASTDRTRAIASENGAAVIEFDEYMSRVRNWNRTLDIAKELGYTWVRLLFSGDEMTEHDYQASSKIMSNDANLAIFKPLFIDSEVTSKSKFNDLFKNKIYPYIDLLKFSVKNGSPFGPPSAYLINVKEIDLRSTRFNDEMPWAADWSFCLDIVKKNGKCYFSSCPIRINMNARSGFKKMNGLYSSLLEEKLVIARRVEEIEDVLLRRKMLSDLKINVLKRHLTSIANHFRRTY